MARQEGIEPPTHSLEGCCSIQLSYWRSVSAETTATLLQAHQVGAPGFEPGTSCSQSRRDTRLRYAPQRALQCSRPANEGQRRAWSAAIKARKARPRWLTRSFSSALASANVAPVSSDNKYGPDPNPPLPRGRALIPAPPVPRRS